MKAKVNYSPHARVWKDFKPPTKPGGSTLTIYENALRRVSKSKNPKVLILGVTPELRLLASKYSRQVTCVDINMDMINAMNELVPQNVKNQEIILKSDWLEMPLKENYYDIVLGDNSINHLNEKDYEKFFQKVKEVIKPNGFLTMSVILALTKRESILKIFESYRKLPKSQKTNIWSDLNGKLQITKESYDPKKRRWYFKGQHQTVMKLFREGKLKREEVEPFDSLLKNVSQDFSFSVLPRKMFERKMNSNFTIVNIEQGKELWWENWLIYTGKPR